ncbi:transposase [Sorangium sp. So ce887]|uniref:transposase n=1 Tax=Sorangium sp. So ce887 TaxID=3133324 RepID=UPI003F5FE36D
MKALSWIEAHIDALSRWLVEAGTRLLGLSGRGEAQSFAPSDLVKVASQLAQDLRRDVDLLREMQQRSERNAVAVSPRTTVTRAARKPRFTEREIHEILAQARRGKSVHNVCDELGISASTFYRWRSQHTGRLVESG